MDINTQNSSGMMNGMPPVSQPEKKVGPLVGALVIVLILIIAALYFFGQKLNNETLPVENTSAQQSSVNTATEAPIAAAEADDVATLQADLDSQLNGVEYSF